MMVGYDENQSEGGKGADDDTHEEKCKGERRQSNANANDAAEPDFLPKR